MSVSFHGIGQVCATFLGTGTEGQVVKVSTAATVAPCEDGNSFCGVALCVKDDACAVQVAGFVTVPYSSTEPTPGYAKLSADGTGGVKTDESGREYLVVSVDTAAKTVTILL